jgi:hypothetical protein
MTFAVSLRLFYDRCLYVVTVWDCKILAGSAGGPELAYFDNVLYNGNTYQKVTFHKDFRRY